MDKNDRRLSHVVGGAFVLSVGVIAGVVTSEPTLERFVRVDLASSVDLFRARGICGELQQHAVRIFCVQRTAVAVLKNVCALWLPLRRL